MNRYSAFCFPAVESVDERNREMPVLLHDSGAVAPLRSLNMTEVLTIGNEATVFRAVQRALRGTGWAVAHAHNIESALRFLHSNRVAAVVFEAIADEVHDWKRALAGIRTIADAPEVIVLASSDIPVDHALGLGAHDVLRRPLNRTDVLWSVASAWHHWTKRHETGYGGGRCSGA